MGSILHYTFVKKTGDPQSTHSVSTVSKMSRLYFSTCSCRLTNPFPCGGFVGFVSVDLHSLGTIVYWSMRHGGKLFIFLGMRWENKLCDNGEVICSSCKILAEPSNKLRLRILLNFWIFSSLNLTILQLKYKKLWIRLFSRSQNFSVMKDSLTR